VRHLRRQFTSGQFERFVDDNDLFHAIFGLFSDEPTSRKAMGFAALNPSYMTLEILLVRTIHD
jgi:hypothetical protein